MADRPGVTIRGAEQVASSLRGSARALANLYEVHAAIGARLVPVARSGVPNTTGRGTGALAGSIRAFPARWSVRVAPGTPYGAVIERGYPGTPGRRGPHNIRPARYMARARESAPAIAEQKVTAGVRSAVKVKGA